MRKTNAGMVGLGLALGLVVGVTAGPARATLLINSAAGYNVTWDGNDGDFFDAAAVALAPDNLALSSNGGTAFGTSELGLATHFITNVNNGTYGNASSWIGAGGVGQEHIGVMLPSAQVLGSVAFGRDNGNGAFDDSVPGTDCCGGQADDRWGDGTNAGLLEGPGTYTLQITTNGGGTWTTIATLDFNATGADIAPGGAFTPWLRHEFDIRTASGGGVLADGVRILVPNSAGIAGGTAVDEIELYLVPEPASIALLGLGGLMMLRRHRA